MSLGEPPAGMADKTKSTDCGDQARQEIELLKKTNKTLSADLEAERELSSAIQSTMRRLERILDSCSGPVADYDFLGAVMYVNSAFERTFGVSGDEIRGQSLDIVPEELKEEYRKALEMVRAGQALPGMETQRLNSFGMEVDVLLDMVPAFDQEGNYVGHSEYFQDITAKKMVEDTLKETQSRYEILLETSPDPIVVYDIVGSLTYMNTAFEKTFGLDRTKHLGLETPDIVSPEAAKENEAQVARVMEGCTAIFETRRIDGRGRIRDILASMAPYVSSDGAIVGRMEILRDITESKRAERRIRQAEETYRTIFENAAEGIFQATPDGRFLKANNALAKLMGYESPDGLVNSASGLEDCLSSQGGQHKEFMSLLSEKGEIANFDARMNASDGGLVWASLSATALTDENGGIMRIDGLAKDITERKIKEMEMRRKATRDELTGLPNRFLFHQNLEKMLAQAQRADIRFAVLYVDLDYFKNVNDTHGHHVGDLLLKEVAERMKDRLRETDVAARVGGDEFILLLWNIKDSEDVELFSRHLIANLNDPFIFDVDGGVTCHIGASVGATLFPDHGRDPEKLLKQADAAMYAVKEKGKNEFCFAPLPGDSEPKPPQKS